MHIWCAHGERQGIGIDKCGWGAGRRCTSQCGRQGWRAHGETGSLFSLLPWQTSSTHVCARDWQLNHQRPCCHMIMTSSLAISRWFVQSDVPHRTRVAGEWVHPTVSVVASDPDQHRTEPAVCAMMHMRMICDVVGARVCARPWRSVDSVDVDDDDSANLGGVMAARLETGQEHPLGGSLEGDSASDSIEMPEPCACADLASVPTDAFVGSNAAALISCEHACQLQPPRCARGLRSALTCTLHLRMRATLTDVRRRCNGSRAAWMNSANVIVIQDCKRGPSPRVTDKANRHVGGIRNTAMPRWQVCLCLCWAS